MTYKTVETLIYLSGKESEKHGSYKNLLQRQNQLIMLYHFMYILFNIIADLIQYAKY